MRVIFKNEAVGFRDVAQQSCCALWFLVFAVFVAVAPALATSSNQFSRPVGVMRILVPATNAIMSSIPFELYNDGIAAILDGQLVSGASPGLSDKLIKWDNEAASYITFWKTLAGEWRQFPQGFETTNTIRLAEGFWIHNRQSTNQYVFWAGEVVLEGELETAILPGLQMLGHGYGSVLPLNDSSLFADGAYGANVQTNADEISHYMGNDYARFWLLDDSGSPYHEQWVVDTNELAWLDLLPGEGYWYNRRATNAFTWTQARPFADVFPSAGAPLVTNMLFNSSFDEITLYIETSGMSNEVLEIFYQDVSQTNSFMSTNGWKLAEFDLTILGQSSYAWTDSGGAERPPINEVFARYYIVSRADLDSDMDGIPDGREILVHHTDATNPDTDGDGVNDGDEIARGTDPLDSDDVNTTIYVNAATGNNDYDGYSSSVLGGGRGPKANLWAGEAVAIDGDTIEIAHGTYAELPLALGEKRLTLRPSGTVLLSSE